MADRTRAIDLDASLGKLSEWLAIVSRAQADADFKAERAKYLNVSEQLRTVAGVLGQDEWFFLEEAFNENPPPGVGHDGMPIPYPFDNAGRYKGLCWALRELAETAEKLADEYPKPRTKPVLPLAGRLFLCLWLEAGKDRPSLYNTSPAVAAFKLVLDGAGIFLSGERVRGVLSDALENFDPFLADDQRIIERLMVMGQ